MTHPCVRHLGKVAKKLDKNCGFSNKSMFLGQTSLWGPKRKIDFRHLKAWYLRFLLIKSSKWDHIKVSRSKFWKKNPYVFFLVSERRERRRSAEIGRFWKKWAVLVWVIKIWAKLRYLPKNHGYWAKIGWFLAKKDFWAISAVSAIWPCISETAWNFEKIFWQPKYLYIGNSC